ncbi:glycosyltransferase family 39 protein [Patescibacteria group bacterium]|nr:glycosyltransferase family 39 protein [Patescibacteria group bacterium]
MKDRLKKSSLLFEIIPLFFGIFLFFLIRLPVLQSIPVYLDEAVYINWAFLFKQDHGLAYASMQDGKTPLYFWIVANFLNYIKNPLIAARLVSVLSGAGTLITIWLLARFLFGKKTALLSVFLYLLIPYSQFIERMAFADSLLVFWGTLAVTISFIITETREKTGNFFAKIIGGIITGAFLGLAFLTKSSAKIYLVSVFLIIFFNSIKQLKRPKKIFSILIFGALTGLVYHEIVNALRVGASRFFLNISTKEKLLTFSPKEILQNLFSLTYINNFSIVLDYLTTYLKLPLLLIMIYGVYKILKEKRLKTFLIVLVTSVIFSAIFFSSKIPASRYFFPIVPFVAIIGSYGFLKICSLVKGKYLFLSITLFILIVIAPFIKLNLEIILNPKRAGLAYEDRHYLLESDLSGIGVEETIQILEKSLKNRDTVLIVDSFWGQPDYIEVAIKSKPLKNRFLLKKQSDNYLSQEIKNLAKTADVFFFFLNGNNHPEQFSLGKEAILIKSFSRLPLKTGETRYTYLYKFNNPDQ